MNINHVYSYQYIYEFFILSLLNGLSFGLLLFLLSAGLTIILSMLGVLNFAHASFYMLGAYTGYTISQYTNFWWALLLSPIIVGSTGALFERYALRRTYPFGHLSELLLTFGLSYIMVEGVQLFWGRDALPFQAPNLLNGTAFILFDVHIPKYKLFMMIISLLILFILSLIFNKTRLGLVIQAALTHPKTLQTLGHNVPDLFTAVFATGTALAALAGVMAAPALMIDPSMADTVGSVIFVVIVVGGMGSLSGAFMASLLLGCLQTFAVSLDYLVINSNVLDIHIKLSQLAPILPYIILIIMLIIKPNGFLGKR